MRLSQLRVVPLIFVGLLALQFVPSAVQKAESSTVQKAGSSTPSPQTGSVMVPNAEMVARVNAFVEALVDAVKESPGINLQYSELNDAYDVVTLHVSKESLLVIPSSVVIPSGVRVQFRVEQWTDKELQAEANRLIAGLADTPYALIAANRNELAAGLKISFADGKRNPASGSRSLTDEETAALGRLVGIHIPLTVEGPIRVALMSRNLDTAPFYGGDLLNQGSAWCSGGFVAFYGSGAQRTYGMLTADHCGHYFYYGQARGSTPSHLVGRTHIGSSYTDSQMLINGAGGSTRSGYSPQIFRGDWQSYDSRAVKSASDPTLNMVVCNSGGFTGELCNLRVVSLYLQTTDAASTAYGFLVRQLGTTPRCAGQGGDSGGATYSIVANDARSVKGMIHGGDDRTIVSCPQPNPDVKYQPYGYRDVVSIKVDEIESDLQVAVATSDNS